MQAVCCAGAAKTLRLPADEVALEHAIFTQAAEAMRDFVHAYHEKQEEEQIFPRFKKAGRMVDLVGHTVHLTCETCGDRFTCEADVSVEHAEHGHFGRVPSNPGGTDSITLLVA